MRKVLALILLGCCLSMSFLASAETEAGENLIQNGDFAISSDQMSMPAAWTFQAYDSAFEAVSVSMDAVEGIGNVMTVQNVVANDSRIYQDVAVEPNTVYSLSALIQTDSVQNGQGATLSVDNYSIDGLYCYSDSVSDTSTWSEVSLLFRTGKEQKVARIALRLGGYGAESVGTASFADVELYLCDSYDSANVMDLVKGTTSTETAKRVNLSEGDSIFVAMLITVVSVAALFGILYRNTLCYGGSTLQDSSDDHPKFLMLLFAAFLFRLVLSLIFVGHSTDINCFMAWGNAVAEYGTSNFYTSGMFADYPPGYMYICGALATLCDWLNIGYYSAGMVFLFKLPATIADILTAVLIYRLAECRGIKRSFAFVLSAIMVCNPAAMFVSGAWGQIDSVLALLVILAFHLFLQHFEIAAGAVYALAILLKPQALMFGPLFAIAYFTRIVLEKQFRMKQLLKTAIAVVSAFAVLFALSLPFKGEQQFGWLIEKYADTAGSYAYASIEAFNMPALLGDNWAPVSKTVLGVPYTMWGSLFIAAAVIWGGYLYIFVALKAREKENSVAPHGALYLASACMLALIFTFGHYMHERYLFPILLLLLMAYLYLQDRRILFSFGCVTVPLLLNILAAMYIVDHQTMRGTFYDAITRIGSLATVSNTFYLVWISFDILVRGNRVGSLIKPQQTVVRAPKESVIRQPLLPKEPTDDRVKLSSKDRILMLTLTLVYAIVAICNLGTLSFPETHWQPERVGETVTVSFDDAVSVNEYWVNGNIADGGQLLIRSDNGFETVYEQTYGQMFRWHCVPVEFTANQIELSLYAGDLNINEIAFFDAEGNLLSVQADSMLFDEQNTVPERPSYFNGMYFDELYHARTAYEHVHNLVPYEISHPPLGKLIIAIGILLFGMNPFGWRIMGTLVGVAMLPILYVFAKRLIGKTEYAFLAAGLFAVDFMHFTQTRIATIDVYAVFFILLMYYYMYRYLRMNFFVDGLKKTLKPLAICGVFFGLGAASKWTCLYAGAGLAVLFFGSLFVRYREYRTVMERGTPAEKRMVSVFWSHTVKTLLWCCIFYLAIPIAIYVLSYMPYYIYYGSVSENYGVAGAWKTFWDNQNFMFNYHSGLTATHPYQSSWWQWPFTLKPMWYYSGNDASIGMVSTMTASGNPAVWWVGSIAAVVLLVLRYFGYIKKDCALQIICIGILANYLPWVLVSRCTFIYHFFTTVPFVLLSAVYLLAKAEEQSDRMIHVKWIWLGCAAVLFALLYPGLSGLPVDAEWASLIKMLPGGSLMYGA